MASIDFPSVASTDAPAQALTFKVEAFTERHLPMLRRFSEAYWDRPRTEQFYRWRYLQSMPFSRTFIAHNDTDCLGLVAAFRKRYIINGAPTDCLELFDWHALPGFKGSGVGIRVVRALMREGVRVIGLGGTADVLKALPAMGFQQLGGATNFELPLVGRAIEEGFRKRVPIKVPGERWLLNALTRAWYQPRRRMGEGVTPVAMLGEEVADLYSDRVGYDVVQVPNLEYQRWLSSGYPFTGAYSYWYFVADGKIRGWAMTRVYDADGRREAAIVDLFTPNPTAELYRRMVADLSSALAGVGPDLIRVRTSCPLLQASLLRNRYRPGRTVPIFTWPKGLEAMAVHMTLNHSDAGIRPYPVAETGVIRP